LLVLCAGVSLVLGGAARAAAPDNALQFNGSSQYVTFGPSAGTGAGGLGATQFTLETWFKKTGVGVAVSSGSGGLGAAVPLVTKGRGESDSPANLNMNYFLGISGGKLAADFEDAASGGNHPVTGVTTVTDNVWHHAAATYDGSTWRLYLDGKLDQKLVVGGFTPESSSIQHAALATAMTSTGAAAGFFQGQLDEARIWGVARSGAEIRGSKDSEVTGPATGLLGRWGFDDGTATDSSGRGINGTLFGSPSAVAGEYAFPQDVSAPGAVQNLAATPGDTTASLTWSANGESDLAGYNVYRALSTPVPTGGTPLNGSDLLQATGFNDSGLANGTTYHYAVIAVDGSNNPSTITETTATPSGQPVEGDPVLVGAGDIADCGRTQDTATAALVSALPGAAVFTAGDNTYAIGSAAEWAGCYDPTWGAFKNRTRPGIGNHDYGNGSTPGATPYFDYFNGAGVQTGPAGDRSLGYYSYDLSGDGVTWHIVMLNSECEPGSGLWLPSGCAAGSAQEQWLRDDLQNAPTNNIIAIWHKPRWSSGGSNSHMQAIWQALYDYGVDAVVAGHVHNYERFAPMNASGAADPTLGVREFVVGTGGAALQGSGTPLSTSEVRSSSTYGVMKFTLHASSYDWQFIPISGQTFTDSGTQAVHGPPDSTPPPTPSIVSSSPSSPADDNTPELIGTAEPGSTVRLYTTSGCSGQAAATGSAAAFASSGLTVTVGDNASTTFRATATDAVGNVSGCSAGFTYVEQSGAPAGSTAVADFDGDGDTDVAIYRPSDGVWYVKGQPFVQWGGQAGDVPVPGDYDGDGKTDLAVYRPSDGVWYVKDQPWSQWGGQAGDVPVPGDYDGDGHADIAIYRPSDGVWYVKGQAFAQWGGQAGDVPVPGDYDGDGKTDLAVYRPSDGVWYVKDQPWSQWGGQAGDVPLSIPPATRLTYYP
jgi:hypothetical protein